jgi:hypothetical protein
MAGQTRRPLASLALVAVLAFGAGVPTNAARADDCLSAPDSPAPEGSHWYYHIDRATQTKCWHVRAIDQPAEQTTAPAASDASAVVPAAAIKKPATSSGAPMSISPDIGAASSMPPVKPRRATLSAPADAAVQQGAEKGSSVWSTTPATAGTPMATIPGEDTPSLPRVKVLGVKSQDAPVSGTTADQPGQEAPQKDPVSSTTEVSPGQPSPSSQIGDPATAPAAGPAPPDPLATSVKTPDAAASDTRTESGRPSAERTATDNAQTTAQNSTPVTQAELARSPTMGPIAMFAVAALGLVVAGLLLRIVMKISSGYHQRVDRRGLDWVQNRYQGEPDGDRSADQPDGLSDYLQRSAIPTSLGSGRPPSRHTRQDSPRDADAASRTADKIGEHRRRRINIDPRGSDWVGKLVDDLESALVLPSDYRSAPPLQDDDSWPDDKPRNDGASQSSDEIREREEALKQLKQDLDRLLQSPKVAQRASRNRAGRALLS